MVLFDKRASNATTFVTECGSYHYLRAPQSFQASGDHYTKRKYEMTKDIKNKREIVDDTLLFEDSLEKLFWTTMRYIKLCADNCITFNPEKFHFGETNIEFAGFEVTADYYKPTKNMLQSISNFPVPKNITDMRSSFGLIEQVSYAFSKSEVLHPFRELLKKMSDFYWSQELTDLFILARSYIVDKVVEGVKSFELGVKRH